MSFSRLFDVITGSSRRVTASLCAGIHLVAPFESRISMPSSVASAGRILNIKNKNKNKKNHCVEAVRVILNNLE